MEATLKATPLIAQVDIRELCDILNSYHLEHEKEQITNFADYMDKMEAKYSNILEELSSLRGQLSEMQDNPAKSKIALMIERVTLKVKEIKHFISTVKSNLIKAVKYAVAVCKEKGKCALVKTVHAMKIPSALSLLKVKCHQAMEHIQNEAGKINEIRIELYQAKTHKKIAMSLFKGKEKEEVSEPPNKGILAKIEKICTHMAQLFSGMETLSDSTLQKIKKLDEIQKPSVKSAIGDLKAKQPEKRRSRQPVVEVQEK